MNLESIAILGAIQSLIGALVFLLRPPAHLSQRILSAWFGINALNFVGMLLPGGLVKYLGIGYVPFLFLIGPLFFFYLRSQIHFGFRLTWKHAIHLLPFVLVGIVRLILYRESLQPSFYFSGSMPVRLIPVYAGITLSLLAYLIASLMLLKRHQRNLRQYFATESQKETLRWGYVLVCIVSLSYLLLFFAPLFDFLSPTRQFGLFWYHQFNLALLGTLILVFGLLQPVIYRPGPVNSEEREEEKAKALPEKYPHSSLDPKQMQAFAGRILTYLADRKPYLDSDYSLEMMAKDLNITRQNLSQTINEQLGKNFYTLVNEHRIAEFTALVKQPKYQSMTFLALAFEAGFNSKSSFYRTFKEVTGETPSAFLDRLKQG